MSCSRGNECVLDPKDPSYGCGEHFASVESFDAHHVGSWNSRRCLTEAAMLAAGFTKDSRGFWRDPKESRKMLRRGASLTQRHAARGGVRPTVEVQAAYRESRADGSASE